MDLHVPFALRLAGGPVRFRRLQPETDPITRKELTQRLREPKRPGLVAREIFAEVPPRVEDHPTDLDHALLPVLEGLHAWAAPHGDAVADHRRRGDATVRKP